MQNRDKIRVVKTLAPIAIYLAMLQVAEFWLIKYRTYGPVNSETGKPIFLSFPSVIHYFFLSVLIIGAAYSLFQISRIPGLLRYCLLALILAAVPIQYVLIFALKTSLFGK